MLQNLNELAKENLENIKNQSENLFSGSKDISLLKEFEDYLTQEIKVSVNIKHHTFLKAINDYQYKCASEAYETLEDQVEHFGGRSVQRLAFDNSFVDGGLFKYMALNSGNFGTPIWGQYCIVFNMSNFDESRTVVLMKNSLEKTKEGYYYFHADDTLNIELIKIEVCTIDHAKDLILVKHNYKLGDVERHSWANLVCSSGSSFEELEYVELITSQKCDLKNNFVLRFKKKDAENIFSYLSETFEKRQAGEASVIALDEFKEFIIAYEKFRFEIEII